MNEIFKIFLTLNATFWVIVVYGIKEEWAFASISPWGGGILLLLAPVLLSVVSIWFTLLLDGDNLECCKNIDEANNSFLPTYLGYFFVGLGVEKWQHMFFIYLVIFVFTYVAQTQYFNPIFLLFGYRFYNVETSKGTKIFLIARKELRKASDVRLNNLKRINNTTFIAWRNKDEPINGKNT